MKALMSWIRRLYVGWKRKEEGTGTESRARETITQQPVPPPPSQTPKTESRTKPDQGSIEKRKRLRKLVEQRRSLADTANHLISRLTNLGTNMNTDKIGRARDSRLVSYLYDCDFHLISPELEIAQEDLGRDLIWYGNLDKQETNDLVDIFWPIDTASIVRQDKSYTFERILSVETHEMRGRVKIFAPKSVRAIFGHLNDDGTWWIDSGYYGLINGSWKALDIGMHQTSRHTPQGQLICESAGKSDNPDCVGLALSNLLTQRYEWHVALAPHVSGPRILLPTSPTGCREFFKNRDIAMGKSRRDALRHWVTRHYRDQGNAGLAFIRQHLRGATEFQWSDLYAEVMVSDFDLEKNEEFRLEAEQWRATRKHNRVRIKIKRHQSEITTKHGASWN